MPTPAQDYIALPPYQVIQPGAYSSVDASLLTEPNAFPPLPIPGVLGVAYGGAPNTPLYFRSPTVLRQVLRKGPAYDVARFALNGGAQKVCVIRVGNSPTTASLALLGTGTCVTLTSLDYGSWNNSITITVATGPKITLSYTNPLGVTYTEQWDLTGVGSLTNQIIADAINGNRAGFTKSNYVSAAAGSGTLPLGNISASPLAGGTDGASPAAGDWTTGLTAIESEDVSIVVPATGDATVHAQVQQHCINMASPTAKKERTTICGGVLAETPAQAISRLAALPSGRVKLCYPGIVDFNDAGAQQLYDPFYLAGKLAGMACALPDPATSLIHNYVPVVGVERNLSAAQGGDIDQLLYGNVSPVAKAPGAGYWVVDSLTGYTGADQTFHDYHKIRSADFVSQYARAQLESQFVGSKNLATAQASITAAGNEIMAELLAMGVIYGYQGALVTQGQTVTSWQVGLPVMLVDATKFILISVQLQPSSVTSVTGSTTAADALT